MYDPELYRDKAEVELWKTRDPLDLLRARLEQAGAADAEWQDSVEDEVDDEIDAAVEFAESGTFEPVEELTRFVYTEASS
jgi:pyruvate dehydrogenase E1 component alpha subunit